MYDLQTIEVTATRASHATPVARTEISHETIERNNYGLDVPYMLTMTPRWSPRRRRASARAPPRCACAAPTPRG